MDETELLSQGREELPGEGHDRGGARRLGRRGVWVVGAVCIGLLVASGWVGYRVGAERVKAPHGPTTGSVVVLPMPGGWPSGGGLAAGSVWVTVFSSNEDASLRGSVVRVDPATGKVVAQIQVGAGPFAVAGGFGSVWVSNGPGGTVTRIDPATNRVIATIPVGPVPYQMAPAAGRLWVSTQKWAVGVNPASNRVDMKVPLPLPKNHQPPDQPGLGLAADDRGVWVSTAVGTVVRIRPQDGKVIKVIPVVRGQSSLPGMVVIDGDHVWVSEYPSGNASQVASSGVEGSVPFGVGARVLSLSVATNRVDHLVPTGGWPVDWMLPTHQRLYMLGNGAAGPGSTADRTGVLIRSDWPYDDLTALRVVGGGSFAIMIAGGHMWIPSWDKKSLYRLPADG